MKRIILATTALPALFTAMAALSVPVHADTVFGCEVVDKGGYSNKVDPNCEFTLRGTTIETPEDRDDRSVEGVAEPEDDETETDDVS